MREPIFRKVTLVGETCGYWSIEDVTELYHNLGDDAEKYFATGVYDGNHKDGYTYGYIECLGQSDWCPPFLWHEDIIKIIVEEVETGFNERND